VERVRKREEKGSGKTMPITVKLEKFEGPLDLLLQLIEREDLPITEVSLSSVTDQYLRAIKATKVPSEDLADFLLVAAKLLLIKSRILLPQIDLGLEEEGIPLDVQLRMYKEFVEAAKIIDAKIKKKQFAFVREKPPFQKGFFPPKTLTSEKMAAVFREIVKALEPVIALPKQALERAVSIQDKIARIRQLLSDRAQASFSSLLREAKNKTEVIVSFLALLELVKQKIVDVDQEKLFEDIEIKRLNKTATHV